MLLSPFIHKIYLFEGENKCDNIGNFSESYFDHLMTRLLLKDGIKVFLTKNTQETQSWILLLFDKLQAQPELYERTTSTDVVYSSLISTCKKENLTPATCYILQLKQIPGVSEKIATTISKKYPSIHELIEDLRKEGSKCLEDILISNRKISKTTVSNISKFLQI
jgi:ERCC4-type nuclease